MERAIFKTVLLSAVCGVIGKYVYVEEKKTWDEAQEHCRRNFTDLSPISSYRDEMKLREAATALGNDLEGWIGLYRVPRNLKGWRWSGGGKATYTNWERGEPNYFFGEENYGEFSYFGWHTHANDDHRSFYCLKWIVVKKNKTWQEAMWYCKRHHTDLISLSSETEVLLAQREMQEAQTTDHVWTGLRYFGNGWLWVNGDPLGYEAWLPGDQDHQCPAWSHRCGALNKTGQWQNYSCQEKLNFICY